MEPTATATLAWGARRRRPVSDCNSTGAPLNYAAGLRGALLNGCGLVGNRIISFARAQAFDLSGEFDNLRNESEIETDVFLR